MSKYQKKKVKTKEERELEIQGAKFFGKHVSREKGRALLIISLIACALPMILGAKYWNQIPLIVESGLVGTDGKDDSIPRWMVAFGLPALMMLLNFLCHFLSCGLVVASRIFFADRLFLGSETCLLDGICLLLDTERQEHYL